MSDPFYQAQDIFYDQLADEVIQYGLRHLMPDIRDAKGFRRLFHVIKQQKEIHELLEATSVEQKSSPEFKQRLKLGLEQMGFWWFLCELDHHKGRNHKHWKWQQGESEREARITELRTMPYPQYLGTKHWKKFRAKALDHADHRCCLCNSPKNLHVHHRTYVRRGCELLRDVVVLCNRCHRKFHSIMYLAEEE